MDGFFAPAISLGSRVLRTRLPAAMIGALAFLVIGNFLCAGICNAQDEAVPASKSLTATPEQPATHVDEANSAEAGIPETHTVDATTSAPTDSAKLKSAVRIAFAQSHEGWSADEVILDDRLHTEFIAAVQQLVPGVSAQEAGWTLLNLRKAGKLDVATTRQQRVDCSGVVHIAEIAARSVLDRYGITSDRMMVDPQTRAEFDAAVLELDGSIDAYVARRAAFKLRKTRRLRPELITRIADWGRTIHSYTATQILEDPECVNEHPGIYIFRDSSGYLYIGQTENLRERLTTHLDESHNKSLAAFLTENGAGSISIEVHDFDPESRARETMIRRAYESELIASRQPRFNIQP